ncbi:hypothetical protein C9975_08140 [Thalassospira xiamenensis]|nr:hypothetical protein C9975_08140 [Thalassospira xiamenensis]
MACSAVAAISIFVRIGASRITESVKMLADYNAHETIDVDDKSAPLSNWKQRAVECFDAQGKPNYLDSNGQLKDGIYLNMPNDLYHSLPALSSSGLKKFSKSPAHYFREYLSDICDKRTATQRKSFDAGSYSHELVLEPEGFYDRYFREVMESDYPRAIKTAEELRIALSERGLKTTGTKDVLANRLKEADPSAEILDVIVAENRNRQGVATQQTIDGVMETLYGGKLEIRGDIWEKAHRAEKTVRRHPQANTMFSNGLPEITFIARCPDTGLMLKCKFDWLRFDDDAVDLKTSQSAEPSEFNRFIRTYRYDLQESFYTYVASLLGVYLRDFIFVAVEFEQADICQPFRLTEKRKSYAKRDFDQLIQQFKKCKEEDYWPGYYENTVIELD